MAFSFPDLKGKVYAVTGAASGMGRAISLILAKQGANVGLLDLSSPDKVAAEIAEIAGNGHAIALPCNVTEAAEVDASFQKLFDKWGRLDGAANMAGTVGSMKFGQTHQAINVLKDEDWDFIMKVNLDGVKNCLRAELRLMKGPGSIVNASSISGQAANPYQTPYSSSKWAVIGLTKGVALEVGKKGIRVNAVAPGVVMTPLIDKLGAAEMESALIPKIALGRCTTAEEVAKVIVFLLSDVASYISGSVVNVDGGFAY